MWSVRGLSLWQQPVAPVGDSGSLDEDAQGVVGGREEQDTGVGRMSGGARMHAVIILLDVSEHSLAWMYTRMYCVIQSDYTATTQPGLDVQVYTYICVLFSFRASKSEIKYI